MNYASLYNMRSCFTVKRGGDPRDPWRRVVDDAAAARRDTAADLGGIDSEGNISRINFAIGEFYVRAGSIYYEEAFAATRIRLRVFRPTVFGSSARALSSLVRPSPSWGERTVLLPQLARRISEMGESKVSTRICAIPRSVPSNRG